MVGQSTKKPVKKKVSFSDDIIIRVYNDATRLIQDDIIKDLHALKIKVILEETAGAFSLQYFQKLIFGYYS